MDKKERGALEFIVAIIGTITALAGTLTLPDRIRVPVQISLILIVAVVLVCLVIRRSPECIPKIEPPISKTPVPPEFTLTRATAAEVIWMANLEKNTYEPGDAVPLAKLQEWYNQNPSGFLILRCNDEPVGHLDILPVNPDDIAFERFRKGIAREVDLPASSILPPSKKNEVKAIYVESIIISKRRDMPCTRSTLPLKFILGRFISILQTVAEKPAQVDLIFTIAATKAGKNLITKLGFVEESEGATRVDEHAFYWGRPSTIAKRIKKLCGDDHISKGKELEELLQATLDAGL